MSGETSKRLVILSGPSCVGKSPLDKALGRFYPVLRRTHCGSSFSTTAARPGRVRWTAWTIISACGAKSRPCGGTNVTRCWTCEATCKHSMSRSCIACFKTSTPSSKAILLWAEHSRRIRVWPASSGSVFSSPPFARRGYLPQGAGAQCFALRSGHGPHEAQTAPTYAPTETRALGKRPRKHRNSRRQCVSGT